MGKDTWNLNIQEPVLVYRLDTEVKYYLLNCSFGIGKQ